MLRSPLRFQGAFTAIQGLPPDQYQTSLYRAVELRHARVPNPNLLFDQGPVSKPYRYSAHPTLLPPAPFQANPLRAAPFPLPHTSAYTFRAIYMAEDPLTAYREFHQDRLTIAQENPLDARLRLTVMMCAQVTLQTDRILDLTRPSVRIRLRTTIHQLTGSWRLFNARREWAPTQLLGYEAFRSAHYDAIRFPSTRNPGGVCVLIFTERSPSGGPSFVRVDDIAYSGLPVEEICP
jgi:RES domain-containing protein